MKYPWKMRELSTRDMKKAMKILVDVTPKNFGRIAAQAAKQVMIQRLREAERNIVYDEFYGRTDDIITGIIQRIEQKKRIYRFR